MNKQKSKILFIDDDIAFLKEATQGLKGVFEVKPCTSLEQARERLTDSGNAVNGTFDLILLDLVFGQNEKDKAGIPFLRILTEKYPDIPVIVVTQHDSFTVYQTVQEAGAKAFFVKSALDFVVWINKIEEEIEKSRSTSSSPERETAKPTNKETTKQKSSTAFADSPEKEYPFLGNNPQIVTIREELEALSEEPDISVLLLGETGVGKEVAARYLHSNGVRSEGPFRAVNLVAIGSEVLESTLFGHKKGSFTGAIVNFEGAFEEANRGVLFLDEIGEIDSRLQQKMLRFLEDKVITPLGGKEKQVDVQIVAATNKNLKEEVSQGSFRLDLYHRLNDYAIVIPPLRERREDIKLIADYYLVKKGFDRSVFTDEVWGHLYSYSWPGNIRELVSTIKRLLLKKRIEKAGIVDASFLSQEILSKNKITSAELENTGDGSNSEKHVPMNQRTAIMELQEIEDALIKYKWKKKVVEVLGFKGHDQLRYLVEDKYFKEYPELFRDFPIICKKYKLKI